VKVTNDKTENNQAFLTIEADLAEVEESLDKSYRKLVHRTRVPGFRKGKAPRDVLERHIGRDSLIEDALNTLVPEAYEWAIKEEKLEAIAQPQIEVEKTEPLLFKAIVPLKPRVELGDYHSVRVTREPVEVTGDRVDAVMEHLRHQFATWEPVERPVEFSDLLVIDVESNIEGKPFINQTGAQFQVLKEMPFPASGIAENVIGMKKEEEKEFQVKLPEDYPDKELAEKEAAFKVKITEIKQEILPELNDEFAKQVEPDSEGIEALREKALSDLTKRAEEQNRIDFENRVIDEVVKLSKAEFPPIMVEIEVNRMLNQRFQRGQQEMEAYLSSINKKEEELREEISPMASENVTRSLVLGEVAEQEKIEVTGEDIDNELETITKDVAEDKREELKKALNSPQARASIEQTLLGRKTVQRLSDIASDTKQTKGKKEEEK